MSEEERLDIVSVSDESGRDLLMRVERYFYYNGQEYVHLRLMEDEQNGDAGEDRDYVMRVDISHDEEGEEIEDFVPLEREQMDRLIQSILINYAAPPEDAP